MFSVILGHNADWYVKDVRMFVAYDRMCMQPCFQKPYHANKFEQRTCESRQESGVALARRVLDMMKELASDEYSLMRWARNLR